jgi:hypothetical protein
MIEVYYLLRDVVVSVAKLFVVLATSSSQEATSLKMRPAVSTWTCAR